LINYWKHCSRRFGVFNFPILKVRKPIKIERLGADSESFNVQKASFSATEVFQTRVSL
jgi:hypothetical protein